MLDRTLVAKETAPPTGKWNILKLKTLDSQRLKFKCQSAWGRCLFIPAGQWRKALTLLRFPLIPVTMAMVVLQKAKESQCWRGPEVLTTGFSGKAWKAEKEEQT